MLLVDFSKGFSYPLDSAPRIGPVRRELWRLLGPIQIGSVGLTRFSVESGTMACAAPHPFHWDDLRNRTPKQILTHAGISRSRQGSGYELQFLNALYHIDPMTEQIIEISPFPSRELSEEFQILLIRYLIAEDGGEEDGKEVSEKDFPGGVTFFQGPHALRVAPIARLYGKQPDAFESRALELGAVPSPHGDKAMRFHPFPQIPVTYVLWREDDEFPASVTVLFDSSITRWFELDMIFTLVWVLTERIVESGENE